MAEENRKLQKEKFEEYCRRSAATNATAKQREAEEKETKEEAKKPVRFQVRVTIRSKEYISARDEYIQRIRRNATREKVDRILLEKYWAQNPLVEVHEECV
jgi:hypothetical protein